MNNKTNTENLEYDNEEAEHQEYLADLQEQEYEEYLADLQDQQKEQEYEEYLKNRECKDTDCIMGHTCRSCEEKEERSHANSLDEHYADKADRGHYD